MLHGQVPGKDLVLATIQYQFGYFLCWTISMCIPSEVGLHQGGMRLGPWALKMESYIF